jgi:hypothetical protein
MLPYLERWKGATIVLGAAIESSAPQHRSPAQKACGDAAHRHASVAVAGVGLGEDGDRHCAPPALEQGHLVDEVPVRASPPAA